jgi:hypothetical protein
VTIKWRNNTPLWFVIAAVVVVLALQAVTVFMGYFPKSVLVPTLALGGLFILAAYYHSWWVVMCALLLWIYKYMQSEFDNVREWGLAHPFRVQFTVAPQTHPLSPKPRKKGGATAALLAIPVLADTFLAGVAPPFPRSLREGGISRCLPVCRSVPVFEPSIRIQSRLHPPLP